MECRRSVSARGCSRRRRPLWAGYTSAPNVARSRASTMTSGSNVAPRARLAVGAWLAMLLGAAPFAGSAHEIEFASVEKARTVLGARDDFVARLSSFDRAARVKSADDVSEDEYLAFARAAAREWSNDERARLESA